MVGMSHTHASTVRTLRAAAAVWLVIGALVLTGVVFGVVAAISRTATTAATAAPSTYQLARPQREDAFWDAYQASPLIATKMPRINAISVADQMCLVEGGNPGGVMASAQSRHYSAAALAETAEMLRLAEDLC